MLNKQSRTSFTLLSILMLLAFVCAFSLCAGASVTARAEVTGLYGEGTPESPKLINNVEEFMFFVSQTSSADVDVRTEYLSYSYRLANSLDLSEALELTTLSPIGSSTAPFNGSFNGNGFIIKGLKVSSGSGNVGLFGYLSSSASISQLGVVQGVVSAPNGQNVGGLVGYNAGTVSECFYNGSVNGYSAIGGLVGYNEGKVEFSFANANVSVANDYLGGIIGRNNGSLSYSYSLSKVNATATQQNVGALIGSRDNEQKATPSFTFYNFSINEGVPAVGIKSGESEVDLPENRVKALERTEFNDQDTLTLFDAASARYDRPFKVSNHSLYAAPIQKVFASRYVTADDGFKNDVVTACSERMYSVNLNATEEWGSFENPYLISNETQLRNLQTAVNEYGENYQDKVFRQNANVSFTSRFYPIGNYEKGKPFQGRYDGANLTISNLNIFDTATETSYLGLFGYVGQYAVVENLTLDETCSVSGIESVGSLIGYNLEGTVRNVHSLATVSGSRNVGGIVGATKRGVYEDVLSSVKLVLRGVTSGGLYGVIGTYYDVAPDTINNVWYFTQLGESYTSTNQMGNVMILDGKNGKISAEKNNAGDITFKQTEADARFSVEFRNLDESVVSSSAQYTPEKDKTKDKVVYARFVRELQISTDNAEFSSVAFRTNTSKLYSGQSYAVAVSLKDGAFVKSVTAKNDSYLEIASVNVSYQYESNTQSVVYFAKMTADCASVEFSVATISWDPEMFKDNYTYNGKAVEFPIDTQKATDPNIPEDYTIVVNYGSGSAPVEANLSNLDNYSLIVVYQNIQGVRMGAKNATFHISKAPLSVAKEYLSNEKQWDDSLLAVPASVDQAGVVGVVEGDDVVVEATMRFHTKSVTQSEALKATVTYAFSLSGTKARNYSAPTEVTYSSFGVITKRQIKVAFDSYTGTFAGVDKIPDLGGKKVTSVGNITPYEAVYTFNKKDGGIMGAVGEYELRVSLSTVTYPDAINTYEISFENAESRVVDGEVLYTYKTYIVLPREVEVRYFIDDEQASEVVYDATAHSVRAEYTDVKGGVQELNLIINDGNSEVLTLLNAGAYTVSVSGFSDANYNLGENASTFLTVNKAEQEALSFTSATTHSFGSVYVAEVSGGSDDGAVSYEVLENSREYATFDGNELTVTKAGLVSIKAIKAGSDNYLEASVELVIEVVKVELTVFVKDFSVSYLTTPTFVLESSDGTVPSGVEGVVVSLDGNVYNGEKLDAKDYQIDVDLSTATSDGYLLVKGESGVLTVERLDVEVVADARESVYGEPLKELTYTVSEANVTLVGSLSVVATNVGEYDIAVGDLNNDNNPNYNINFVSAKYVVTARPLTVVVTAQTKEYGDVDPAVDYTVVGLVGDDTASSIGLVVNVMREQGEESYFEGVGQNKVYNYLKSSITHASSNYASFVEYEGATLTILPKAPSVLDVQNVSIQAGTLLSENGVPNASFVGNIYDKLTSTWQSEELSGSVAWSQDEVPSFREHSTLIYKATFTPENKNFKSVEFDVNVSVIARSVTVKFTSSRQLTYNGTDQNKVSYEIQGLIEGEPAFETVEYIGDYRNAGSFKVKVSLGNANYTLMGTGETTIKINKSNLEITANDITALEGEELSVSYIYNGFEGGENEKILTKKPSVTLPSKVGTYSVKASGATADNYEITYLPFVVKILTTSVVDVENEDVFVSGRFDADTVFTFKESEATDDVADMFYDVQSSYKALEGMWVEKVYDLSFELNDENVTSEETVYLTMPLLEGYENVKVAYAILTNQGEVLYVQDVLVDGANVTVNVTNAKAILILAERETDYSQYILYGAIGLGAFAVLVIVIAVVKSSKKRREARYINYDEE